MRVLLYLQALYLHIYAFNSVKLSPFTFTVSAFNHLEFSKNIFS